nr:hypothetical protein [Deltaproteobacteria bacterium]
MTAQDELAKIGTELRHKGRDVAKLAKDAGKVIGKAFGEYVADKAASGFARLLSEGDAADSPPNNNPKKDPRE